MPSKLTIIGPAIPKPSTSQAMVFDIKTGTWTPADSTVKILNKTNKWYIQAIR